MMDKSKQKMRSWGCVQEKPTEGKVSFLKNLSPTRNLSLVQRPEVIVHINGEGSVL